MESKLFWIRKLIFIFTIFLLLLPLIFFALQYFKIPFQLSLLFRDSTKVAQSERYAALSEAPGYVLKLSDTAYLDSLVEKFSIFNNQAIVDPRVYRGFPELPLRYTVTNIRFVLSPYVESPIVSISGTAKKDFASRGEYFIEDSDTLVVRISLNTEEVFGQFALEEAFLTNLGSLLYYAHGISPDVSVNGEALLKIKHDMKNYVYTGIFAWPFAVEKIGER